MIDALTAGRLYGQAGERTGQSESAFATGKVRTAAGDGETIFCNVIAFDDAVRHVLLAPNDEDSVALSGALTPKVWMDKQDNARPALDLIAHAVLTPYHITRKRRAAQGKLDIQAQDADFDDERQ